MRVRRRNLRTSFVRDYLQDDDDLLRQANDTMYGLSAGIWTRDITRAHRFARAVKAGTVWINTLQHDECGFAVWRLQAIRVMDVRWAGMLWSCIRRSKCLGRSVRQADWLVWEVTESLPPPTFSTTTGSNSSR